MNNKKGLVKYLILSLLIFIVFIVGINVYSNILKNKLTDQVRVTLSEVAYQNKMVVESQISEQRNLVQELALVLKSEETLINDHVLDIIKKIYEDGDYKNIGIVTPEKTVYISSNGEFTIEEKDYFENLEDKESLIILDNDTINNQYSIFISEPVTSNNGGKGCLFFSYDLKLLVSKLSIPSFNGEGYTYIVDSNGNKILNSNNKNSFSNFTNIFDAMLKVDENNLETVNTLKEKIKNNEEGIVTFSNETNKDMYYLPLNINECCEMHVNHITLQDLIRFQKIDFELIEGLYYDEKRDTRCQEVIQYLFNQRNIYKKQHNPIEQTFKLVMNSVYGKTIMKPINYKIKLINGEDKYLKFENKNYNHIYSAEKIYGSDTYQIKMINGLLNDFNLVQFGSVILSISKRIISEVFCLAENMGFKIYYTDTDSGHFRECEINKLADEFKKIYGRDLIGSNLGQFHCDFNNIENNASMPVSVKSIFLGKKSYIDMLLDDKNNLAFHVRMKGIPASTLEKTANEMFPESISVSYKNGLFIPKINSGIDANYSIFNLYKYLYEHNPITFELVNDFSPRFQFNKNRTIESKRSFERTLLF